MEFRIGQVQINFSSGGLTVIVPTANHEIRMKLAYLPQTQIPLEFILVISKLFQDKPYAQ